MQRAGEMNCYSTAMNGWFVRQVCVLYDFTIGDLYFSYIGTLSTTIHLFTLVRQRPEAALVPQLFQLG